MDIGSYLARLDRLIEQGRGLHATLATEPSGPSAIAATRVWQRECAATVHLLSGGTKAHWLARAYSEAFLVRSTRHRIVEEAPAAEIVDRIVQVLRQAMSSLSQAGDGASMAVPSGVTPRPRRFDFVHNRELRPILEQAYADGRCALELGDFRRALILSCSVLEAIITDALEHQNNSADHQSEPSGVQDLSFERRVAVAEQAGLVRGCGRLPAVAWTYRELADDGGESDRTVTISERDARLAGQVLHVIMRDLDPGR